jgi:hypothetical protein
MFDVYSEINVRYILKYFMYVPVVVSNNQLLSRNLISHQAFFYCAHFSGMTDYHVICNGEP